MSSPCFIQNTYMYVLTVNSLHVKPGETVSHRLPFSFSLQQGEKVGNFNWLRPP